MSKDALMREDAFESRVLREAAESLNFIWLLASTYRAPELLEFVDALGEGLIVRGEELTRPRERPR